jgi:hypothetical protein
MTVIAGYCQLEASRGWLAVLPRLPRKPDLLEFSPVRHRRR